jgi:hypothetical protein
MNWDSLPLDKAAHLLVVDLEMKAKALSACEIPESKKSSPGICSQG